MDVNLLHTMVLDTWMPLPASECQVAASPIADESSPSVGANRIPLEPVVPFARIQSPTGQGDVVLFTGGGENALRLQDAALAFLLTATGERSRSLLVDLPSEAKAKRTSSEPVRVAGSRVWRVAGPADGGLRAWLLFLHQCRIDYTTTVVALPPDTERLRDRLATLADRTLVVTTAGHTALAGAQRVLCEVRRAGARRCECLWLDAA